MKIMSLCAGLLLLFFTTISCNPKLTSAAQSKDVKVSEAYTQLEVPGQEKSKPIDYLKLKLDVQENSDFETTSVLFRGKRYSVQYNRLLMRINLGAGIMEKIDSDLQKNQALLSYTINGKEKTLLIENIETKEAIYLP